MKDEENKEVTTNPEQQPAEEQKPKKRGLREILVNDYGIADADIGYSDNGVTVKGDVWFTPDQYTIGEDNRSYIDDPNLIRNVVTDKNRGDDFGVRETLVNNYGFDDAGLGADEYGNVTYYGQVILPADQVQNRNNITYVSDPSVLQKAASAYNAKGDVGVRADAENYGMSGSRFGYDDKGNVLYDGMIFLTADQVKDLGRIEGNTVFLSEADMMDAVLDYKKNTGNEIVPVRSYVQSTGSPVTVEWQNGMVNVNGEMIKPDFVKDGVAYVNKSQLDKVIASGMERSGISNPMDIVDMDKIRNGADIVKQYQKEYQKDFDTLRDRLVNREEFDYNPEDDIVFQAYQQQYNREGDRAMRDAAGSMAALTGGYANSMGATAAAQQRQYWGQQLMDRIPELANAAYNRYTGEFDMDNSALTALRGLQGQLLDQAYGANRDNISDYFKANDINYQRWVDAYNRARAEEEWKYKMDQDAIKNKQTDRGLDIDQQGADDNSKQTDANVNLLTQQAINAMNEEERNKVEYYLELSAQYGRWIREDILKAKGINTDELDPREFLEYQSQQKIKEANAIK